MFICGMETFFRASSDLSLSWNCRSFYLEISHSDKEEQKQDKLLKFNNLQKFVFCF
jgi:hypothetical protein